MDMGLWDAPLVTSQSDAVVVGCIAGMHCAALNSAVSISPKANSASQVASLSDHQLSVGHSLA